MNETEEFSLSLLCQICMRVEVYIWRYMEGKGIYAREGERSFGRLR